MKNKHILYDELKKLKKVHESKKKEILTNLDKMSELETIINNLEKELVNIEKEFVDIIDKINKDE